MGGLHKEEFPALLPPGRHAMTMAELERICVTRFDTSATRPSLMAALRSLVGEFEARAVACDFWVDGSFITEKVNPDDVDLSIRMDGAVFDTLDPELQQLVLAIAMDQHALARLKLHTFVVVTRPREHPEFEATNEFARWMAEFWQVSPKGAVKGMPVIRLGETRVGLQLPA